MSAETRDTRLKQEAFNEITDRLDSAKRIIESAENCLSNGDFLQAAVSLGSLSHEFTNTEMVFFEVLSEEDTTKQ